VDKQHIKMMKDLFFCPNK